MDDDLEKFIKEQKAKVAEDKASLDQEPPYMEIRTKAHKAYDLTIKENIPPFKRSTVQEKEDGYCVSLPLGVDYERKKQKLQQELRMDYRRYMAQKHRLDAGETGPSVPPAERRPVKELPLALPLLPEGQRSPRPPEERPPLPGGQRSPRPPEERPPSRKDAATLTEGRRGVRSRALRPIEGRVPWPEEGPPLAPREGARLGRLLDYESEEEYTEEEEDELELVECRRLRHTRLEPGVERRRPRRYYRVLSRFRDRGVEPSDEYPDPNYHELRNERVKKETQTGGTRAARRPRASTNKDEAEFATGLMIGEAERESALQRRKERYRQELQEQIAEQQRNKKREKDLELKVAATGATDPEKQPDRIKQFGASRRRAPPPGEGQSSCGRPGDVKLCVADRERLPPEQPCVAFQSPLLEYSSALGLGSGGLSPYSQPPANTFPRRMDTPRIPAFPPHPPPTLADAYRGPYEEAYHYYGARNLLDPNLLYYGHLPMTGGGLPMSYLSVPPGGALASQMGHHSPHSQHSGSSHPEPPTQPHGDATSLDSGIAAFPAERARPSKESMLSYKEALRQQIQERQERLRLEREEKDRYEAQLEADMIRHQPWGRGGGGAPLRDSTGNLITDLNQMHKLNEEAYIHPEQWQKRTTVTLSTHREERPASSDRVSGFAHVHTPQFARGNVFNNQATPQQLQEQDKYKAYLKQQIEEKRCKQAEERARVKEEEEKEETKLAAQRAHIQREYEDEQERKKRKEMEQKAKNEELTRLAEERKKEVERKKKESEEKENAALRRQYEKERQARLEEVHREPSPPIPTLLKRHGAPHYTPTPPTMESRRSTAPLSERSLSGLQSPPVPARKNQLRAAEDQRSVFNELSPLRRKLRSEQKRLEGQLLRSEWEELDSLLSDRRRERPQVDVFDMARLRLQAPVRRPSSRTTVPSNLLRIHDSLQLKYTDGESRASYGEESLDVQRQVEHREQQQRFNSLRRRAEEDYFDRSPPLQNDYLRLPMEDPTRGSLLQSESAFIDPLGDVFPMPPSPEQKTPQLSARERRRLAKRTESHHERGVSKAPAGQPESFSLHSESSLNRERERHTRTGRLLNLSRHHHTPGALELSSEDDPSPQASPRGPDHRSSVDTVATDPWMRPGTSDTLKRLMSGPSRRERLTTRDSAAVQDWGGPSTYHG